MSKSITPPSSKVDWATMGFQYRDLNGFMRYTWTEENGWDNGRFETNPKLDVHMCSTGLNYGQQCFEGLKAFRDSEGRVRVFRPEDNAERMMHSADIGHMPHVPKEIFLEGIKKTVEANLEFVPPKETGGSLYIRPLLFGSGPFIGMGPAPEFTFVVFAMPVGPYYSGGVKPVDAVIVEDFDRSAPNGTGSAKLGGNYAPTLAPMARAKKNGYPLTLHLDAKTHTLIDEFSTSNFVGLTYPDAEGKRIFVTPDSNSILKSVTRRSLAAIAQKFGWGVEERPVALKEVEEGKFAEVAACGTAAIITPVKKIVRGDQVITIGSQDEIGEGFKKLYDEYRGIQGGDVEDTFNWLWPKEGFKGLAHEKTQLHVQEPVLTLENTKALSSKYDFAITNSLPIWTKKDLEFFKTAAGETVFSQLTVIPEPGVIPNFSTMTSAERLFKSLFHYFDQRLTEDPTQDVTADPSWTFYERLENALYPWLHPHWENAFHLVNKTEGQGIVLCVGNGQFKFAASTIRVLREILHTQLPIEVFFIREDDLSVAKRFYLSSEFTDVTLRKLDEAIGDYYTRFGGWAMKPFAMLASRFTEVIMMDADAFFLQDPTDLFDDLGYKTAGSLFFYDRTLFPNWNLGPDWLRSFLPTTSLLVPKTRWFQGTSSHEQESGVIVMNKRKSLLGLLSACKLNGQNERDQVVYRHVHGDKETFWIGHEITQTPYAFIKSFGAVIGNMGRGGEDGEPTQVCGVQLHLDTESRPLWFNGGLYRNKYKEPLEYLNFTHFAQGEHWEFATHCIKDTDKISELGPDQRTVALAAIEIDKQREKDQALLDQGRWKPKGYP